MRHKISWLLQLLKLILSFPLRRAVLIGSPEHGNLGDQAISIAERILLKNNNIRCAEIAGGLYRRFPQVVKFFTKKKDVICINGGGFLGSLWKIEDDMVNDIILKFNSNRVVISPQTLYFTNDDDRQKFVKIYASHKDLHLFLRENNSFELAKNILKDTPCKVYLAPDMVLSLSTEAIKPQRKNMVLLCLRTDKESILNEDSKKAIDSFVMSSNAETKHITTNPPHRQILFSEREKAVREMLTEIKSSKLLIADRLHAMIFAYITGTPCCVFDNLSRKVSGVYEWIKDCGYIKYCDQSTFDGSELSLQPGTPKRFEEEFKELVKIIKGGE
ncbi:MAG: polysaccharide pyruvyl transferase family protein [Bacteroidales bacterium]|nr:polysaccharide pyruvyl transferase family protein [Bacteroidales bacterium]